jgi:exonuclease SbcD
MRFLHTSDWHLGRTLHGVPLLAEQRHFLQWLREQARVNAVDAVLVAGDVYDRAVPPTDAVALLDEALAGLSADGVAVVMTSGNHDSAIRLGFGAALAERAGVHLRTQLADLTSPVRFGPIGIYGIPFLLPDAVLADLGAERSHTSVLRAALARVHADAAERRIEHVVVLAHAFVTGGSGCESERDISVGGIGDVPAGIFDGCRYVALGHLHGAQQIAATVRYSGSPLAFSFSERHHHKSVSLVDVDAGGAVSVQLLPVPVRRGLHQLRGRLADLLGDPGAAPRDAWVKAVLTDGGRLSDPMSRLREVWPNTVILEVEPESALSDGSEPAELVRPRDSTDPVEVCAQFVAWVDSTYPDDGQRAELRDVLDAVRRTEVSA